MAPATQGLEVWVINHKVYIHELIDIIGHNRARYMHHMTANWAPIAREERNQLCYGVWGTVGSTGQWPQVVNMWELEGWDGLAANFEHEFSHDSLQDPSLAEWWATAASLRHGGEDRILVPAPWTAPIGELVRQGVRGHLYLHEIVTVPAGRAGELLDVLEEEGSEALSKAGVSLVGAFRVAMVSDSECMVICACPSWRAWAEYEQAWEGGGSLSSWRRRLLGLGASWNRTLMVDAPLSPMRIGRQPLASDRRSLDDL